MKRLNSNGSVSIVSSPSFKTRSKSGNHDSFYSHGQGWMGLVPQSCNSGAVAYLIFWTLKDGTVWLYGLMKAFGNPESGQFNDAYYQKIYLPTGEWKEGLAYNFYLRSICSSKLTNTEWQAFLSAH